MFLGITVCLLVTLFNVLLMLMFIPWASGYFQKKGPELSLVRRCQWMKTGTHSCNRSVRDLEWVPTNEFLKEAIRRQRLLDKPFLEGRSSARK
uniref:Uncharacterized protein n=1 Tax=Panagrellus redivivus TaxID=6233 RepID=A0A7E4UQY1_PANRE